jgi:Fe2+ transport system protein FeoA
VVAIVGTADARTRLMELGFCPGTRLRVVRRAPLGCPLEVEVGGTRFSIRCDLARAVLIEHA